MSSEHIKTLYEECTEHHRYMLEWRHRILLRYFVASSAFAYVAKWMWETNNAKIHLLLFLPFLLISICSVVFFGLDKRNIRIVDICRKAGRKIELGPMQSEEGLMTALSPVAEGRKGIISYTWMLALIYLGSASLSLAASVCLFLKYKTWCNISTLLH